MQRPWGRREQERPTPLYGNSPPRPTPGCLHSWARGWAGKLCDIAAVLAPAPHGGEAPRWALIRAPSSELTGRLRHKHL